MNLVAQRFRDLLNLGINPALDMLDIGRLRLLNFLTFLCVLTCLVTIPFAHVVDAHAHKVVATFGLLLLSPIFILNSRGRHEFSRGYFLIAGSLLVSGVSILEWENTFTGAEQILFLFMVLTMLLLSGSGRHVFYWLIFLGMVALVYFRDTLDPSDRPFEVVLFNISVVSVLIYLSLESFASVTRKMLYRLMESEKRMYSLIDNIPLFIGLLDKDGKFKVMNKRYEELTGLSRKEMIGRDPMEFLPKWTAVAQEELHEATLKNGQQVFNVPYDTIKGQRINFYGKFTPVVDQNKEIKGVTLYVEDITELEKIKEQLAKVNKEKDRLFSIIAHDIRSPLDQVELLLNAGVSDAIGEQDFKKHLELIQGKYGPLRKDINTLLEWSRLQLDGIKANPSRINVKSVADEALNSLRDEIQAKQISCTLDGCLEEIDFDKDHMKIVFRNLLHNAIKFTPKAGTIDIQLDCHSHQIQVIDSGIGVSQSLVDDVMNNHLVEPSFGTNGEQGTGLGLNLTKTLIEKNQCTLGIEPREIGTCFYISLPKIEPIAEDRPLEV